MWKIVFKLVLFIVVACATIFFLYIWNNDFLMSGFSGPIVIGRVGYFSVLFSTLLWLFSIGFLLFLKYKWFIKISIVFVALTMFLLSTTVIIRKTGHPVYNNTALIVDFNKINILTESGDFKQGECFQDKLHFYKIDADGMHYLYAGIGYLKININEPFGWNCPIINDSN